MTTRRVTIPATALARPAARLMALAGLLALTAGCAAPRPAGAPVTAASPLVWPPPPAPPRIAFVQSIAGPADLGIKRSGWSRLGAWITGRDKSADALEKPFGIALDASGNLCLTEMSEPAVWFFDRKGLRFRRWARAGPTRFISPVGIAWHHGNFYVADSGLGRIVVFNDSGKLVREIKQGLTRPSGIAIVDGKVFVADASSHRVCVFDPEGQPLFEFGHRGSAPGEFNFPTHIAAGAPGQLLVTDSMNARLQIFGTDGRPIRIIGQAGDTSGHFSRPKGAAADGAGRIYVIDALFDNVQVFDADAHFLLDIGQGGKGPGEFWLPNGIAISGAGEIFVTDAYNHRVQVLKYVGPE